MTYQKTVTRCVNGTTEWTNDVIRVEMIIKLVLLRSALNEKD